MRALGLTLMLLTAGPAAAEVYKWTDAQGRVHYGDRPGGRHAQEVATDPASRGLGMGPDTAREQQRLLQTLDEERAARKAAAEEAAAAKAKRQRNCTYARDRYESVRHAGYLYEPQSDGGRRVLSDAERRAAEAQAREAVRHWCGQ